MYSIKLIILEWRILLLPSDSTGCGSNKFQCRQLNMPCGGTPAAPVSFTPSVLAKNPLTPDSYDYGNLARRSHKD